MTRGGRTKERDAPERRCVATGARGPKDPMIRFALSPDGVVTPDLAERLPGRGVWVSAERAAVEKAVRKGLFARGFKCAARAPEDLLAQVEALLARRAVDALGFARKAGLAVGGFDKTRARLREGPVAALIEASDGAEGGRAKLRPLAAGAPVVSALAAQELGLAFGREFVIHAALDRGGAADRFVREAQRLAGFRAAGQTSFPPQAAGDDDGKAATARPIDGGAARARSPKDEAADARPAKDGS